MAGPHSNYVDEILRAIEEQQNQAKLVDAKHGAMQNNGTATRDYYNLMGSRGEDVQGFQSSDPDVDLLARLRAKQEALTGARDNELALQGQPREDVFADPLARANYRGF